MNESTYLEMVAVKSRSVTVDDLGKRQFYERGVDPSIHQPIQTVSLRLSPPRSLLTKVLKRK